MATVESGYTNGLLVNQPQGLALQQQLQQLEEIIVLDGLKIPNDSDEPSLMKKNYWHSYSQLSAVFLRLCKLRRAFCRIEMKS